MAITKLDDDKGSNKYDEVIDASSDDNSMIFLKKLVEKIDESIDLANTHITDMAANNAKVTFPGFGTTNKTALVGNTTTITGTQANTITANEKAVTSYATSITGLTNDMKAVQQNLTVMTDSGIEAKFENLKAGLKGATIDLKITDNNGKSPKSYKATIQLQ